MPSSTPAPPLAPSLVVGSAVGAAATFHLGFLWAPLGALVLVSLGLLVVLRRAPSSRWAFYAGLAVGLGVYGPQLGFFYGIFGLAAAVLWLVLALWHGLFVLVLRQVSRRGGDRHVWAWAAVLWLGLEYFRCELYHLRFAWLTAGYALPLDATRPGLAVLGVYGSGALAMAIATWMTARCEALLAGGRLRWPQMAPLLVMAALVVAWTLGPWGRQAAQAVPENPTRLRVAGVQMEFPGVAEVLQNLRRLAVACPDAPLVVLSEYSFDGPVPDGVRAWCRKERRWLIAGGTEPLEGGRFHNTVSVVDTNGAVVFQQVKAVPIQFFKDGEPAPQQRVWDSPWGKLGLCVCYDLNYTRVVDRLVRLGAQALIVPTMDVEAWGVHEHHLNARLAPIRAAEHRLPVFRVASSGISQLIDARGHVGAQATVPGPGEMISGELELATPGTASLPLDRWAAPLAVGATVAIILGLVRLAWLERRRPRPPSPPSPTPSLEE